MDDDPLDGWDPFDPLHDQFENAVSFPTICVIALSSLCVMTRSLRRWFGKLELTELRHFLFQLL